MNATRTSLTDLPDVIDRLTKKITGGQKRSATTTNKKAAEAGPFRVALTFLESPQTK
jgi:hypothetical protein